MLTPPTSSYAARPERPPARTVLLSQWLATVLVLVVSGLILAQYGSNGKLIRDDGIYLYSGQQMIEGLPPYLSAFDAKGPLSMMSAAPGVWLARLLDADDIFVVRLTFLAFSSCAAAALYQLGRAIGSARIGVIAALVLVASGGFGRLAFSGSNPKTLIVLLQILLMLAIVKRRWFLSGILCSLAVLTWQPMIFYAALAPALLYRQTRPFRRRLNLSLLLAGMVLPALVVVGYLAVEGAIRPMIEGTFVYPFRFLERKSFSLSHRLTAPAREIWESYRLVSVPLFLGFVYLLSLAVTQLRTCRWRLSAFVTHERASVVHFGLMYWILWSWYDFQNYPDAYPLLPFGALGFALLVEWSTAALVSRTAAGRIVQRGVFLAVVTFLAVGATITYRSAANNELSSQRTCARQLEKWAEGRITAIDRPELLALLNLRSPTRYVFTFAGMDDWIRSRFGTLQEWYEVFLRNNPRVIVGRDPLPPPDLLRFLRPNYRLRFAGPWGSLIDRSLAPPGPSGCAITRTPEVDIADRAQTTPAAYPR